MILVPYEDAYATQWDKLVTESHNGTFLHTRRFLSYHGDRFNDCSVMIFNDRETQILGVFPAARIKPDDSEVISHPGSTYGGIVHKGELNGASNLQSMQMICEYYNREGASTLVYKSLPWIYHRRPAQDDSYCLFRLGAERFRVDLSAAIDLQNRGRISSRRKRALVKAKRQNFRVDSEPQRLGEFWQVLEANLARKHNVQPVHTLVEMGSLVDLFPDNIGLTCAIEDNVVAGILRFETPSVTHAQYIAASEYGQQNSALDLVFDSVILQSIESGKRYFNFGISTETGGANLNEGLYQFKTEFGASGVVHEFYRINLSSASS